jgi:hypothetical protein
LEKSELLGREQKSNICTGSAMALNDSAEKIRAWRTKAQEVRSLAMTMEQGADRDHLLRVAESYDITAGQAEARLLRKIEAAFLPAGRPALRRFITPA